MHVLHLIFTAILSSSSNILAFEPFSLPLCNISLILPYTPSDPDPKNLLPTALRPFHYDLKLEPHLPPGNFSFNGHVKINLRCDENTKNITLNAWNITIFEETIRVKKMSDGTTVEHIRLTYNNTQQRVVIHLRRELEALQDYSVSMAYLGLLNNKQMGFYRSSYKDKQKKVRWLATTHFEPTGARLAFPCFDEPNYKATFAITIVRPTNMISLSNMPIAQTISRENSAEDIYDIGVPMSTYLAAFIICDFTFKYSKASKTLFRVWSRQSEADKIEYALEVGPKILDFFEEYFSIAFPLPKQDMIGIPDFIAGAMENWGLVTYKENSFFYHPDLFTILRKWRVFSVVAHELAHQWFGNLVTLKWWNDLWLNEGFATYLMYIACDYVDPTFEMLDGLISERMHDVLELDSTVQSHPVSVIVNHPDEITSIFDTISYGKGAAIIRMMNHFMGERALRKGLTNYLTKLSFKNAIQDDLWYYLSEQSHVDVKLIMDSWTRQSGYPVVEVKRNYDNHSCTITQKRFRIDKVDEQLEAFAPSDNGNLWHIPLSFTTSAEKDFSNTLPKFWMSNNTDKMVIGKEKDVPTSNQSWILFNIKHTVLCRINYDTHNWNLLFNQLLKDHKVIHSINRAQIIFDALNLARANELGYRTAFNLTLYLINEREYLPWKATEKCLAFLNVMLRNTSDYQAYKKYIRKILTPIYEDLGFDEGVEDTPTIKITRMMILNWACGVDHEGCLQKTSELYRLWKSDPVKHPLAPNLKEIVLKYGIKEGTVLYWNFTLLKYQESDVDEEKRILLSALASSKNRKILRRFLKTAVDPKGGIHKHHLQYVFDDLLNTVEGHTTLLDFLRDNWQTVKEILSTAKFKKLVQKLIRFANTEEGIQQLRSISSALTPRKEDMSYSDSNANVRWMQRNFNDGLRVPRIMSPTNLKQNHQVLFWLGALVSINVFSLGSMDICNLPVSDTQLILPDLQPAPNLRYFLPKTVRPTRYILELQPFLPPAGNISFSGLINIDVRCEETTHRITLNLVDIAVDLSSVIVRDITEKRRIEIKSFKEDYEAQQFVIDLAEELSPYDDYTISMKYSGSFSDSIAGLYASPYLDHNGNTKWAIITKFVPTGARRVFPCFDEPDYQAVFVVTMIRSSHLISISNSPIHHTEDRENNVTADTFHPTLPMSTYQLGFAVCDLTFQSRHSLFTLFRVWSRPEIRKQVEYVLDVAPQALEFFEDYLDIRFPLPKLDVITLPFLNEMQTSWNWGMITTRESALVFEPKISSAKHKEDVLGFIFHEIAHQWFGNLVTPAWWNDLWFIEGFATYLQFAGLDNKEPFWDAMNTMFVNKLLFAALDRDAYSGTRPLSHMMNHPAEIENIFNIISFQKGACIIRMMEHFLGEPTFHSGLRAAADNQKQIDVKKLMDSWIHQAGYPVVTVNRNYSSMTAVLFQNRFLIHGTNITSYPEVWFIPVTFTTSVEKDFYNTTPAFWMSASSEFRYLSSRNGVPERNVWMIFNIKATTYCRFNYDTQNWNLLIEQLLADHKVIHHINRAQLIDDSFNLARSKEVSYEIPLKLTTYLSKEMDFLPWQSAFRNFEFIDKMLTNTTANEYLKAYMCKLLSPVFDRIGIEVKQTDSHSQRLLRADVLNWACLMGHHGCLKKAAYLFEIWMDPWSMYSQISPDLKKPVLCSTIRHGGEFQWNLVYDRLLSSKVEKERIEFIRALGCSADPASLERFLNKAVDSDIQEREFKEFFNSLLSTSIGWRIAFDFLCSNSTHLLTRYGSNRSQQIRLLIKSVALSAVNEHQYTELEAVASQFMTQVEHGVITANMKWFESNYYYVTSFLKQQILGKES